MNALQSSPPVIEAWQVVALLGSIALKYWVFRNRYYDPGARKTCYG